MCLCWKDKHRLCLVQSKQSGRNRSAEGTNAWSMQPPSRAWGLISLAGGDLSQWLQACHWPIILYYCPPGSPVPWHLCFVLVARFPDLQMLAFFLFSSYLFALNLESSKSHSICSSPTLRGPHCLAQALTILSHLIGKGLRCKPYAISNLYLYSISALFISM